VLTNEIERRAQEYIEKIDAMGGALAAIERGFIQREIQESAYRYQQAVEQGAQIVVGVNEFVVEEETALRRLKVDLAVQKRQIERLQALKERRDSERVQNSLTRLRGMAQGDENLLPIILECVEAYATLGEICGVLREVFGEYKPSLAW
jgi:methylmalonyl-CoA mutase N-terminal domain/subunit